MATYKVVDADQLDADMTGLADTIRTKGGTSADLAWPEGYKAAVQAIETGKDVSSVTATAADVISGKVFVDSAGNVVTGTLEPVIRHESEFVVSYDSQKRIYVDCGFTPDAVMLSGLIYEGDQTGTRYQYDFAVLFPESVAGAIRVLDGYGSNTEYYSADVYQTANGFMLQYFGYYDSDNNFVEPAGQTYRYVAIKYTESIPAEFDTSVITATPADVVYPKVFIDKDGVTRSGALVAQTYYYGADEPSADLGVDGDIYFVMG